MEQDILPTYGGPIMMQVGYLRKYLGAKRVLTEQHLPQWRKAGLRGMVVHVQSLDEASTVLSEVSESEGLLKVVTHPGELEQVNAHGAVGIMLCASFDDIGLSPQLLWIYDRLGVVSFALSLNSRNMLVDGCAERTKSGLSELGVNVTRRLNKMGILIDVSHTSDRGFWDVLDVTEGGVLATHSNSRAICNNPRNLTDEMVKALADHGGMVGISTYPTLLVESGRAAIDDAVKHIDHLVQVAGVDHVGVGADFIDYALDFVLPKIRATDFGGRLYGEVHHQVDGLASVVDLPNLSKALMSRGYRVDDVKKIMGENFARLWAAGRREVSLV